MSLKFVSIREKPRRLYNWVRAVWKLLRGRGITADLLDLNYFLRKDPWKYQTSELEQTKYRDILSLVPTATLPAVLEVGCAEGVFTKMLSTRADSLTALDSSPTALERARKALIDFPHVDFQQMDVARENPTKSFDLIVASEVLYYLGGAQQILAVGRRMVEWLKPGGYLLLCHMRSQSDEAGGFPVPRWTPRHAGAATVHAIFDDLEILERLEELVQPLYRIGLYRRVSAFEAKG